jgi:hypothetical protein
MAMPVISSRAMPKSCGAAFSAIAASVKSGKAGVLIVPLSVLASTST